jgi:Flp pilus assembly protein TadG
MNRLPGLVAVSRLEKPMRWLFEKIRPKFTKGYAKSESGAAAIEFAAVVLPFIYVLGCIIETGLMLFTEYVLQSSVQDAARQIRTGSAQSASLTAAAFKSIICGRVGMIVNCPAKVTVYVKPATSFASLKATIPSYLNVGLKPDGTPNPVSYDCGQPSQPAAVIATYDWTFTLPFMSFLGNINGNTTRRLGGIAIFRNEPYPTTTSSCSSS